MHVHSRLLIIGLGIIAGCSTTFGQTRTAHSFKELVFSDKRAIHAFDSVRAWIRTWNTAGGAKLADAMKMSESGAFLASSDRVTFSTPFFKATVLTSGNVASFELKAHEYPGSTPFPGVPLSDVESRALAERVLKQTECTNWFSKIESESVRLGAISYGYTYRARNRPDVSSGTLRGDRLRIDTERGVVSRFSSSWLPRLDNDLLSSLSILPEATLRERALRMIGEETRGTAFKLSKGRLVFQVPNVTRTRNWATPHHRKLASNSEGWPMFLVSAVSPDRTMWWFFVDAVSGEKLGMQSILLDPGEIDLKLPTLTDPAWRPDVVWRTSTAAFVILRDDNRGLVSGLVDFEAHTFSSRWLTGKLSPEMIYWVRSARLPGDN